MTDFEAGYHKACTDMFPNSYFDGYYFHYVMQKIKVIINYFYLESKVSFCWRKKNFFEEIAKFAEKSIILFQKKWTIQIVLTLIQ